MTHDFRPELAVFNANLIELLPYAGRYVVIRGQEIQGPFEGPEQAHQAGRGRHGSGAFLVKQIRGDDSFAW